MVPNNYRPNSEDFKMTALLKVKDHVIDILARLGICQPPATIL